jgi:hypothetical protein
MSKSAKIFRELEFEKSYFLEIIEIIGINIG